MARADEVAVGELFYLPARCVPRYLLPLSIIGRHRAIMAHWGEPDKMIWPAYLARRRLHRDRGPP